jgi:hypothetical protein
MNRKKLHKTHKMHKNCTFSKEQDNCGSNKWDDGSAAKPAAKPAAIQLEIPAKF